MPLRDHARRASSRAAWRRVGALVTFFGLALILFGGLALVDAFLPALGRRVALPWPAFIVGIGALLVASAVRRETKESTEP